MPRPASPVRLREPKVASKSPSPSSNSTTSNNVNASASYPRKLSSASQVSSVSVDKTKTNGNNSVPRQSGTEYGTMAGTDVQATSEDFVADWEVRSGRFRLENLSSCPSAHCFIPRFLSQDSEGQGPQLVAKKIANAAQRQRGKAPNVVSPSDPQA